MYSEQTSQVNFRHRAVGTRGPGEGEQWPHLILVDQLTLSQPVWYHITICPRIFRPSNGPATHQEKLRLCLYEVS